MTKRGPGAGKPLSLADAFAKALRAHARRDLAKAKQLCRDIEKAQPDFPGVHYLLGLIALDQKDATEAEKRLGRAVALTPEAAPVQFQFARALAQLKRVDAALEHYQAAASLAPDFFAAHAERADFARENGRMQAAADSYQAALALKADWIAGRNNLGIALKALGLLDAALTAFAAVLTQMPEHALAAANMGSTLKDLGRFDDARIFLEQALLFKKRPDAELLTSLAQCLMELALRANADQAHALLAEARKHLEAANDAHLDYLPARFALAQVALKEGNMAAARKQLRHCLERDPEDRLGAALALAALGDAPAPEKAPAAHVRALFDSYAERFDTQLREGLAYRGPELLAEALQNITHNRTALAVLDLGCGTGLMGPFLRPLARTLTGIDLSARMLDKARAGGLYDHLVEAELTTFLSNASQSYDLLTAADVLVYLGDLGPLFHAAHRALKPEGRFAFTVEQGEGDQDYYLKATQRYAHQASYIERLVQDTGFAAKLKREVSTRNESGQPVPGLLYVLERQ